MHVMSYGLYLDMQVANVLECVLIAPSSIHLCRQLLPVAKIPHKALRHVTPVFHTAGWQMSAQEFNRPQDVIHRHS